MVPFVPTYLPVHSPQGEEVEPGVGADYKPDPDSLMKSTLTFWFFSTPVYFYRHLVSGSIVRYSDRPDGARNSRNRKFNRSKRSGVVFQLFEKQRANDQQRNSIDTDYDADEPLKIESVVQNVVNYRRPKFSSATHFNP